MITAIYDLQGAYDNVHIPTLISKLEALGIPTSICNIIHRYLINRTIIIKGNINSRPRITSRGVPQGSVLSPLLFLTYTIDLINYIPRGIELTMYADDLVMYIKATSIPTGIYYVEQANRNLQKWLELAKLSINPEKSEFMIFSKSTQKYIYTSLRFGQSRIKRVPHHKFLGLISRRNEIPRC
jgi:hypothetical protein